jgi:hypothetical protein
VNPLSQLCFALLQVALIMVKPVTFCFTLHTSNCITKLCLLVMIVLQMLTGIYQTEKLITLRSRVADYILFLTTLYFPSILLLMFN